LAGNEGHRLRKIRAPGRIDPLRGRSKFVVIILSEEHVGIFARAGWGGFGVSEEGGYLSVEEGAAGGEVGVGHQGGKEGGESRGSDADGEEGSAGHRCCVCNYCSIGVVKSAVEAVRPVEQFGGRVL